LFRFLHTSDWQLGMTRHFLSEEAQARFTQDRIDAIRRIGELAREHEAAFVVVAGDVFESNQVARQTVVRALEAMAAIPVPVLLLPGNHDPLDAASVYRSPTFGQRRPANVSVLDEAAAVAPAGTAGIEVVGAPWRNKQPLGDLGTGRLRALAPCAPGRSRVLVGHGCVETLAPDRSRPEVIRCAEANAALADGRIHYLALGDRHSTTDVGETGAIWYSGAPVATDFDEIDPGNVLLVELEPGARPAVTRLPLAAEGAWRFLEEAAALNSLGDVEVFAARLAAMPHKEKAILRLRLVGSLALDAHARLEHVLDEDRELFASIQVWARHTDLVVLPDADGAEELGLSGYARRAWEELDAGARGDGDDAAVARDALSLFFRLARREEPAGARKLP
jgi:DNA repair exonuclease SbcCD nuclease subunit